MWFLRGIKAIKAIKVIKMSKISKFENIGIDSKGFDVGELNAMLDDSRNMLFSESGRKLFEEFYCRTNV